MLIRLIRLLFFPLSILYGLIISLRNYQFNKGIKTMLVMEPTIISVGNLSTGGTGKTPMIEYLVRLLKDEHRLATLSRGYGRKTRGYRMATANDTAETIGDEPLQYYRKFGEDIHVVVAEERVLGVSSLLLEYPEKELFLLDDAYQHRFLQRDLNILLTAYERPFFKDWLLPSGNLREPRKEAARADAIVVTKCPENLDEQEKQIIEEGIDAYNKEVPIFFSHIKYAIPVPVFGNKHLSKKVILISAIANPKPLIHHLEGAYQIEKHFTFPDHYAFRKKDLDQILEYAESHELTSILTTEKDMVRLLPFEGHSIFRNCTLSYVPITVEIDKESEFNELVKKSLKGKVNL